MSPDTSVNAADDEEVPVFYTVPQVKATGSRAITPENQESAETAEPEVLAEIEAAVLKPQPVETKYIHVIRVEADMSDGGLSPGPFHGRLGEDGGEWVRHFENYCAYRAFDQNRALALMKVLLVGPAATWFDSLDEEVIKSYPKLL